MKKLPIILLILILPMICHALGPSGMIMGYDATAAGGYNCIVGTYTLSWTGDWTGDTDKACITSSDTVGLDGTPTGSIDIGTSYGEAGSVGLKANAINEYITYVNGGYVSGNGAYTLWVRYYMSAVVTGQTKIARLMYDESNYVNIYLTNSSVYGLWAGGGVTKYKSTALPTLATWTDIAFTWDQPNGKYTIWKWSTAAWETEGTDLAASMANDVTNLRFGSHVAFSMSAGDYFQIDRWAIVSGYKASKPSGW